MKKFLVVSIAIFSVYCFFVNSDVNKGMRNEFSDLKQEVAEEIEKSANEDPSVGSGGDETKEFSPEAKEYFKKIAYGNEFDANDNSLSKWNQDINIYVVGEKRQHLMDELESIVTRAPTHEPYPYHNKGVDIEIPLEAGQPPPNPGAVPVPAGFEFTRKA